MQISPNNDSIKTEAGTFDCNAIRTYSYELDFGMGRTRMAGVNFLSPRVKFQIIKTVGALENDMPVLDIMARASPHQGILRFILNAHGSASNQISADLVEMGPE